MVNLIYISSTNYNKDLFDFIKSNEFINKVGNLAQSERYDLINSKGINTKGVYIMSEVYNSLTECVEYVKRNNHVFDRDNTVYYIHSNIIAQLRTPIAKHHTDRIKVIRYANKHGGG